MRREENGRRHLTKEQLRINACRERCSGGKGYTGFGQETDDAPAVPEERMGYGWSR